jgi:hypothetical protein
MCASGLEDRRFVASLMRHVLMYKIPVREAVVNFPKNTEDKSIQAAYHALVHFEADEELRLRDPLYKEEQDDYIEFLANLLEKGEDLPDNIIKGYEEYYEVVNVPQEEGAAGFWKSFMRFLNIH